MEIYDTDSAISTLLLMPLLKTISAMNTALSAAGIAESSSDVREIMPYITKNMPTSIAIIYAMTIALCLPATPDRYCGSITTLKVNDAIKASKASCLGYTM